MSTQRPEMPEALPPADENSARLRRAVAGCSEARAWLADWLGPLMVTWTSYQLRRGRILEVQAEDVVQDVWIRLLPELPSLRPLDSSNSRRFTPALLGLARTILNNRIIDLRRAASRRRVRRLGEAGSSDAETPAARAAGPVSYQLRSERRMRLETALEALSTRDRELLVRRFFDELSLSELAEEYGMSRQAVIKARQRARQQVQRSLGESFLEE